MSINISILGSTGSIGTQTLEVVDQFKGDLKVVGLGAGTNIELLRKQIRKYNPTAVSVRREEDSLVLKRSKKNRVKFLWGEKGNCTLASMPAVDRVVIATPGLAGIKPTLAAIEAKKTIALATKEVLVAAGELVTTKAKRRGVKILPVDSEHSAIFQSLGERKVGEIERIILTCSGGPFRGMKFSELKNIKKEQALAHPNWNMGKKITIDIATLMYQGL